MAHGTFDLFPREVVRDGLDLLQACGLSPFQHVPDVGARILDIAQDQSRQPCEMVSPGTRSPRFVRVSVLDIDDQGEGPIVILGDGGNPMRRECIADAACGLKAGGHGNDTCVDTGSRASRTYVAPEVDSKERKWGGLARWPLVSGPSVGNLQGGELRRRKVPPLEPEEQVRP